jgi:hypothetical protein
MIAQFDYITNSLRQTLLGSDYRVGSNFSMVDFKCYNEQLTKLHHYDEWVKLVLIEKSVGSTSPFKDNGEQSWLALSMVT